MWYILGRLPLSCLILICTSLEINHRILFKFEHSLLLIHVHVQFIFFYFFKVLFSFIKPHQSREICFKCWEKLSLHELTSELCKLWSMVGQALKFWQSSRWDHWGDNSCTVQSSIIHITLKMKLEQVWYDFHVLEILTFLKQHNSKEKQNVPVPLMTRVG